MHLAILSSHPIQYYAPLFRELARRIDLEVIYAHRSTPDQQSAAGFGTAFDWDVDLLSGYKYRFMRNVSRKPGTQEFGGCDTPDVGTVIRGGKFDALLVMGWHLKTYIQGTLAAKWDGIPVMVRGDSHLDTPRHLAKRLAKAVAYPALLRVFDAALYVGVRNREYYEQYSFPRPRMFHAPHCVDTRWFASRATAEAGELLRSELGVSPATRLILFAGKLVDFKRPLDVVDTAAALRALGMDVEVLVAGSGQLEPELRARASEHATAVHLLGFQNQSQMPSVYAAANGLVLPSTRETWGLVCNEALACGVPIVVSEAVGCAPDLANDGRVGRSFVGGETESCARALAALFRDPPDKGEIAVVSDRFSTTAAVDGIVSAFAQVVRHRRNGTFG